MKIFIVTTIIFLFNISLIFSQSKVKFADKNIEETIRKIISKPKGKILAEDVENIKTLKLNSKQISNFSGIGQLTNLKTISLNGASIESLEGIGELKQLHKLNIGDTKSKILLNSNIRKKFETLLLENNSFVPISSSYVLLAIDLHEFILNFKFSKPAIISKKV